MCAPARLCANPGAKGVNLVGRFFGYQRIVQIMQQFFGRLVAIMGVFFQTFLQYQPGGRADVWPDFGDRAGGDVQMLVEYGPGRVTIKQAAAGKEFVENYAQRVDVGTAVYMAGSGLFR